MSAIRVALQCWSSNDNYNSDFDYGLVTLTPELAALIEKRREVFNAAHAVDNSLSDIRFFDYSVTFFSRNSLDDYENGVTYPEIVELLSCDAETAIMPESFQPKEHGPEGYGFATDTGRMIVDRISVHWRVNPKHTDVQITTAEISYKDIREMLNNVAEVTA